MVHALTPVIGEPAATLDTPNIHRSLMRDNTSIDWVAKPSEDPANTPMYKIFALKTVVCWFESPMEQARKMRQALEDHGHAVQIIEQPDPAFPTRSVVIVLSDVFEFTPGYGTGVLIRKHAFFIGGQRPKLGSLF
jgi:hypothetical protein